MYYDTLLFCIALLTGVTLMCGHFFISFVGESFQIGIEAFSGNGRQGDIAIDDVTFSNKACPSATKAFNCDFESKTICGYVHVYVS